MDFLKFVFFAWMGWFLLPNSPTAIADAPHRFDIRVPSSGILCYCTLRAGRRYEQSVYLRPESVLTGNLCRYTRVTIPCNLCPVGDPFRPLV